MKNTYDLEQRVFSFDGKEYVVVLVRRSRDYLWSANLRRLKGTDKTLIPFGSYTRVSNAVRGAKRFLKDLQPLSLA